MRLFTGASSAICLIDPDALLLELGVPASSRSRQSLTPKGECLLSGGYRNFAQKGVDLLGIGQHLIHVFPGLLDHARADLPT